MNVKKSSSLLLVFGACFIGAHTCAAGIEAVQTRIEARTIQRCSSAPVIVFENGSAATMESWDRVIAAIKDDATVFAYNRPGYGNSEASTQPRDGLTIVNELRATLRQHGLPPPYILVGHSLGGLYTQLFARAYPQETKGLVLVDAIYPGAVKKTEEFPLYTRVAKRLFFSRAVNQEIDAIHLTGTQVLALSWNQQIPVERLINMPKSASAVGVDFGAFNSGPKLIDMINGLYPNARTTIVDSDHRIHVANPEVVVAAIRRVMPAPACGASVQASATPSAPALR